MFVKKVRSPLFFAAVGIFLPDDNPNKVGSGQPGMMTQRGAGVDAAYTYNPAGGNSQVKTTDASGKPTSFTNTIDPTKRTVTQANVDALKILTSFAKELKGKLKAGSDEMSKALGFDVDLSSIINGVADKMKESKAWNMSIFYSNDEGKDVPDGNGGTKPEIYTGAMSVGLWRKDVPLFTGKDGTVVSAILVFQYQDQTKQEPPKK